MPAPAHFLQDPVPLDHFGEAPHELFGVFSVFAVDEEQRRALPGTVWPAPALHMRRFELLPYHRSAALDNRAGYRRARPSSAAGIVAAACGSSGVATVDSSLGGEPVAEESAEPEPDPTVAKAADLDGRSADPPPGDDHGTLSLDLELHVRAAEAAQRYPELHVVDHGDLRTFGDRRRPDRRGYTARPALHCDDSTR